MLNVSRDEIKLEAIMQFLSTKTPSRQTVFALFMSESNFRIWLTAEVKRLQSDP